MKNSTFVSLQKFVLYIVQGGDTMKKYLLRGAIALDLVVFYFLLVLVVFYFLLGLTPVLWMAGVFPVLVLLRYAVLHFTQFPRPKAPVIHPWG